MLLRDWCISFPSLCRTLTLGHENYIVTVDNATALLGYCVEHEMHFILCFCTAPTNRDWQCDRQEVKKRMMIRSPATLGVHERARTHGNGTIRWQQRQAPAISFNVSMPSVSLRLPVAQYHLSSRKQHVPYTRFQVECG